MVGTINKSTGVEIRLSPAAESYNLALHGTEPSRLSPGAIIQTAQSDLRARDWNEKVRAERKKPPTVINITLAEENTRPYAFDREHVKKATDVADLLRRACLGRMEVLARIDRETKDTSATASHINLYRLYSDGELLAAALNLAE